MPSRRPSQPNRSTAVVREDAPSGRDESRLPSSDVCTFAGPASARGHHARSRMEAVAVRVGWRVLGTPTRPASTHQSDGSVPLAAPPRPPRTRARDCVMASWRRGTTYLHTYARTRVHAQGLASATGPCHRGEGVGLTSELNLIGEGVCGGGSNRACGNRRLLDYDS